MKWIGYDIQPRCSCNKLLAEKVTRPWEIRCVRCKKLCTSADRTPPPAATVLERNEDD